MSEAIFVVVGAFLGVIFTIAFQSPLESVLARVVALVPSRRRRRLSGIWFSYYDVVREGASLPAKGTPIDLDAVEQIQFRNVASAVVGRNAVRSRPYSLHLRMTADSYLTGTWNDQSADRFHFGGVQLFWDFNGSEMKGRFVGRDRYNNINHGIWAFAKNKADLQRLIDALR